MKNILDKRRTIYKSTNEFLYDDYDILSLAYIDEGFNEYYDDIARYIFIRMEKLNV